MASADWPCVQVSTQTVHHQRLSRHFIESVRTNRLDHPHTRAAGEQTTTVTATAGKSMMSACRNIQDRFWQYGSNGMTLFLQNCHVQVILKI